MANRKHRAEIASETVAVLEREAYTISGAVVSLSTELASMRCGTTLYTPSDLASLVASLRTSRFFEYCHQRRKLHNFCGRKITDP